MKKTVIAYPHIHFDREWYREFEEFRLRLTEIFDVLLEEFEKGELEKFFFDGQTSSIDDYLEIHPEKLPKIKKLIKEKKLFVGPFYCLSDMFLTNHKFIRKNLEIGMEMAKAWGCNDDFIGYLADTFGHSNSIYRILGSYGIDKAILWRGVGNLNSEVLWNGLKTVNDKKGHLAGDNLLREAADTLKKIYTGCDVYRVGGDEFLVIVENRSQEEFDALLEKIKTLSNNSKTMKFAIGAFYGESSFDIRKAMHEADVKMYEDKEQFYSKYPELSRRKI